MKNVDLKQVEETKNLITEGSKKGFGYFIKNVLLIILIIVGFYIVGNLETLINSPEELLKQFSKNGWIVFSAMAIISCGIYQLARSLAKTDNTEHFKETVTTYKAAEADIQKEKEIAHKNAVNKRFEATPVITNILKDLIIDLNADRVMITEMHNGTNNLNGLPFIYFDATYEAISPDVKYVSDEFKNFNMGRFPFIIKHFIEGTFIGHVDEIEKEDPRLASMFRYVDAIYGAGIVIQGIEGPLGFLTVTFKNDKGIPSKTKIMQEINKAAQKLSTLLDK